MIVPSPAAAAAAAAAAEAAGQHSATAAVAFCRYYRARSLDVVRSGDSAAIGLAA